MERIFANIYRFGGAPNKRGKSHSYLLLRKEGNLLVSHQSGPTKKEMAEIKRLGGIESQWICHHHDAYADGLHDDLYAQFGCQLHHHSKDRSRVSKVSKCPHVKFGDEGLQHGADFEALFFPSCSAGHSIFRWRDRGKYYLFSSHAIYRREEEWHLGFNSSRTSQWTPLLPKLEALHVDYVFPGYIEHGEAGFYRLNDPARKSLSKALKAKARQAPNT